MPQKLYNLVNMDNLIKISARHKIILSNIDNMLLKHKAVVLLPFSFVTQLLTKCGNITSNIGALKQAQCMTSCCDVKCRRRIAHAEEHSEIQYGCIVLRMICAIPNIN